MSQSGRGEGESFQSTTTMAVAAEIGKIANRNLRKQLIIDVPPLFEPILHEVDSMIKSETISSSFNPSNRHHYESHHLNKSKRFNQVLDYYQKCTKSKKKKSVPVNLLPELSVDVSEKDSEVFVHLTWIIRDLNKNQMVSARDWPELNVAEYELYGYRSKADESLSSLDPAQLFSVSFSL